MHLTIFLFIFVFLLSPLAYADNPNLIRFGVQRYGTADWELAVLENRPDYGKSGFTLDVVPLANPEAGRIAIQAGSVDIIISDWLWTANMRASGSDLTFYPYSATSGALIVPAGSSIKTLADLKGKRLAIAGGELDKNWLLLQALAKEQKIDLSTVNKTFAAPPLISEQLLQGRVDAALTYWNAAAKLEAKGFQPILDGKTLLKRLGVNETLPTLGYVFKADWAKSHQAALKAFLKTADQAKSALCSDDAVWQKVLPLTQANDLPTQTKLRSRYCEGDVKTWGASEQQRAADLFKRLADISGKRLTTDTLPAGTFWQNL
jgi:NitT/TauT family transport system substrate-binding protein